MKKLLLTTLLLLSTSFAARAQDDELEEEQTDGKVKYVLIMPDEKAPDLIKASEASPFGGVLDDKNKQNESGEEIRVSEKLRSMKVVGKSSAKKWVMLGDLILRKGDLVPPIISSQSVQLLVRDVTPDYIEMVWVEKKPTDQEPRRLMIQTDVSPRVLHRLPGGGSGADGTPGNEAEMDIVQTPKLKLASHNVPVSRAVVVNDQAPTSPALREIAPAAGGPDLNTLVDKIFGTPVSTNPPPAAQETSPAAK
jgi:hypothetical protein